MIYFSSDLHFNHNRPFIYQPRNFESIYEMNETIIHNFNDIIKPDDDLYLLGDIMLGDNESGIKMLKSLKGKIHIVLGNHDTATREEMYNNCYNVVEICYATKIKIDGWHFYLSHYPTITSNLEKDFGKHCLLNLYGHTHQKSNFYNGLPFCYHVGVDSHDCKPVSFEQVIEDIKMEVKNCKSYL